MACTDLGACCTANSCTEVRQCFCTCKSGTFYAGATCITLNSGATHSVNVDAWTAVPGAVTAGRTLVITVAASGSAHGGVGKVSWNVVGGETTADGTPDYPTSGSCQVLSGALHMKALGRVRRADNTYSPMFAIGTAATLSAPASGTLEFRQNDTCVGDNAGTYTLAVKEYICAGAIPLSATPYIVQSLPSGGPGTELKALLHAVGITAAPGCKCNEHAKEMDIREAETPGWCAQNMDTILGWLEEQAAARGLPFLRPAAKLLVNRAISRAKRKSAPQGNSQ